MKVKTIHCSTVSGFETYFKEWYQSIKLTQFQKLNIHHITQSHSQQQIGCTTDVSILTSIFYTIDEISRI